MTDACRHNPAQPTEGCPACTRALTLIDIGIVIDELLHQVDTREKVDPHAVPGWKPPTDGRPTPRRVDHYTRADGLITQLEQAAGRRPIRGIHPEPTPSPGLLEAGPTHGPKYGADVTSHSKPGSRPPTSLTALETLANIETAALQLRRDADRAAGLDTLTRGRGIRGEIKHLTWLLTTTRAGTPLLTDRWATRIYRELRTWAADARVTLSYLAPVATLQVVCPDCGGQLKVRADATSDVWCVGRWTVEGPALPDEPMPVSYRCGAVWPRLTWIQLLDQDASA